MQYSLALYLLKILYSAIWNIKIFHVPKDENTLWLRLNYYTPKMWGHRQQWISHKMEIRYPEQLKKTLPIQPIYLKIEPIGQIGRAV